MFEPEEKSPAENAFEPLYNLISNLWALGVVYNVQTFSRGDVTAQRTIMMRVTASFNGHGVSGSATEIDDGTPELVEKLKDVAFSDLVTNVADHIADDICYELMRIHAEDR